MKYLLLLISVFLLAGCATQKRCEKKYPCLGSTVDTVVIDHTIIKRDTIVQFKIKTDTVKELIPIEVPAGVTINTPEHRLNTRYAYSIAKIINNKLYHQLVQHDAMIEQVIKDAITSEVQKVKESHNSTVIVKENYLTGWQWFQVWAGRILAGLFLLIVVFLILKTWLRLTLR